VLDVTREEAEEILTEWAIVTRDRDERVRSAIGAGLSKHRIHQLTGISRSTIDRILAPGAPPGAANVPSGGGDDH
jgi:hypothetical protein